MTFVIVDFTAIIIDIHLLAVAAIINAIVVVIINVNNVAIASFSVNDMIAYIWIVISICSTTLFLLSCCKRLLLFLFLDRPIHSFSGCWCFDVTRILKIIFFALVPLAEKPLPLSISIRPYNFLTRFFVHF